MYNVGGSFGPGGQYGQQRRTNNMPSLNAAKTGFDLYRNFGGGGGMSGGLFGGGAAGGAASAIPFLGAAYMGLNALGVRNQQGDNPMFSGAGLMGYGPQGSFANTLFDPDNLLGGIFGFGGGKGLGGLF